jgi:hypothetical protein
MARNTKLGLIGVMPQSEYLRKIEQTNYQEDYDEYEIYARNLLADFRPDDTFLESDQSRNPSDRNSGVGSKERLTMRYEGSRSGISPDLPDGTFLDHEFMEKDPRGTSNIPDFNKERKQREARGRFIKFSNDDDKSIPESSIHPAKMVSLIRNTQQQFKDRYANFDESFDNFHNGSARQRGEVSSVVLTEHDGTIIDLSKANYKHRVDPVNLLSNRVPGIPRLTEPDHRVKISKYGNVRPIMDIGSNNWSENRNNSNLDHKPTTNISGELINKTVAAMILNVEAQQKNKKESALGTKFEDSNVMKNKQTKKSINPDDITKVILVGLNSQSQTKCANTEFFSNDVNNRELNYKSNVRNSMNNVKINHHMASSIVQATKTKNNKKENDLRESIIKSSIDHYNDVEGINRKNNNTVDNTLNNSSLNTHYIEDSKNVKIYSNIKPTTKLSNIENINFEQYKTTSYNNTNKQRNNLAKNTSVSDFENDVTMEEFSLPGRKKQEEANYHRQQLEFGDMIQEDSNGKVDIKDMMLEILKDLKD